MYIIGLSYSLSVHSFLYMCILYVGLCSLPIPEILTSELLKYRYYKFFSVLKPKIFHLHISP